MADIAENDNAAAAAAATPTRQSSCIRWKLTAVAVLIITSAVSITMLNWGAFFPSLSYDPIHDRVVRSEYVTAKAGHILFKPTISRATYVRAEETGEAIAEFPAEDSTQGFLDRFGFFWGAPSTPSDSDTAHGGMGQRQAFERTESKLAEYSTKLESYEKAKQSQTAEKESSKASKSAARKTAFERAKQSQSVEQERRKASKIKNPDNETTTLSEKDKSKAVKYSAKLESYEKAKQSRTAERESSKASKYSAKKTAYEKAKRSQSVEQERRKASKIKNSDSKTTLLFEKDKSKVAKYSAKIESYEKAKQSQTAERERSKASKSAARKKAYKEAKQSQSVEQERRKASKIKNPDNETTTLSEKDKSKAVKYSAKLESYEKAKQSRTAERENSKASKSAAKKTAYEEAKQSQVAKQEEKQASKARTAQATLAEKDRVKSSKYAAKTMACERAKQSHAAQKEEKEASRIKNAETILADKDQLKASRDSARKTADEKAKQSQVVEQEEREASKIKNRGIVLAEKDRVKASKYAAKITAHEEARQSQAAEQEKRKASRIRDREAAQAEKEKVKGLRIEPGKEIPDTSTSSATSSRSQKDKESSTLTSKAQTTGILCWGSSVAQKALDRITLKKGDEWRMEAEGDEREAGTRVVPHATSGKSTTGISEIKPSNSSPAPRSRTPVELPPKSPGKSGSEPSTSTTDAPEGETEEQIRPLESTGAETRSRETLQGWAGYWNRARREHGPTDTPFIKKYASLSLADSEDREETSSSEGGKITKEDKTSVDEKKDTETKLAASGQAEDGSETGAQKPSRENSPSQPLESSEPSSLWSQVKSAPSDFMAWWAKALRVPDELNDELKDEVKDEVIRQKQAAETTGERILKEASAKAKEGAAPSSEKQSPANVVWKDRYFGGKPSRQGAAYNEDSPAEGSDFPTQEETSFGSTAQARSKGQDESTDAVSEHPKQEESSKHDPASKDRETEWASPPSQYEAAVAGTSETHTTKQKQAANEAADKELYESLNTSWWGRQMMPAWLKRYLPTSAPRQTSSASSKLKAAPSKARRWKPGFFSFPGERAMTIQEQRVATALDLTLSLYSVIDQLMAEGNSHHVNVTRLQKAWDGVSSSSEVLDSSQLINEMAWESAGRDRLQTYPGVVHRFSDLAKSLAGVSMQILNGKITEEMASSWLNESTRNSIEAFVQEIKKRPHFAFDDELVSEGFHWQILTECEEMLRFARDALNKNFASAEI